MRFLDGNWNVCKKETNTSFCKKAKAYFWWIKKNIRSLLKRRLFVRESSFLKWGLFVKKGSTFVKKGTFL